MAVSQTPVVTAKKSIGSFSGIAAGIASVWRGNNGPSGLQTVLYPRALNQLPFCCHSRHGKCP